MPSPFLTKRSHSPVRDFTFLNELISFFYISFTILLDWGEMSFFRVEMGKDLLGIENNIAWATPGTFSSVNYPCAANGENCQAEEFKYTDPSVDIASTRRRLRTI